MRRELSEHDERLMVVRIALESAIGVMLIFDDYNQCSTVRRYRNPLSELAIV